MRLGSAFRSDITGYDPTLGRMRILPLLAVAAAMAAKKGIDAYGKNKAAKNAAKTAQSQQQYEVNAAQKGMNRKALNFASLLRALKREGWYGDDPADPTSFMATKGKFNAADWEADAVPLAKTGSTLGATVAGAAGGALDAYTGYMGDADAARVDAIGRARQPKAFSLPAADNSYSYLAPRR